MSNKKHILCLTVASIAGLILATNASATAPGAYVGGQLGYGNTHIFQDETGGGTHDTGLAGRGFVGFQFNPNIAVEGGYTRFKKATVNGVSGGISASAVDLVAKGIIPLENNFSIFGKLGAAELYEHLNITAMGVNFSKTEHKLYPTASLGVNYDITPQVSTDLSWTRIQKIGHSSDINSTDFFGLGLAYHFG